MNLTDKQEKLYERLLPISGPMSLYNVKHLATIGEIPQDPLDVEDDLDALAEQGLVIRDEDEWFRIPASQDDLLRAAEQIAGEKLSEPQRYALRVTTRSSDWHTEVLHVDTCDGCKRNTLESLRRRGLLDQVGSRKYRLANLLLKMGAKIAYDEPELEEQSSAWPPSSASGSEETTMPPSSQKARENGEWTAPHNPQGR